MTPDQGAKLTQGDHWFKFWMPYAYVHLPDAGRKHVYLPVNRRYKPLGIVGHAWVDYEPFLPQAVVFSADPATFKGVWFATTPHFYLYNDAPASRVDYFERFERLMARVNPLLGLTQEEECFAGS